MLQNITRIWLRLFSLKSPTLAEVSITVAEETTMKQFSFINVAKHGLSAWSLLSDDCMQRGQQLKLKKGCKVRGGLFDGDDWSGILRSI